MLIVIPYLVCLCTRIPFINEISGSGSGSGSNLESGSGSGNGINLESGSGSGNNLEYGSGSNQDSDYDGHGLIVLLVMGPFLIGLLSLILLTIYENICEPIYKWLKKMMDKCRESRKPQLIHKGKLSKTCINGLNKSNIDKVNVQDILECSICIEQIELEKYKIKKNNLVFLNCSQVDFLGEQLI